MMRVLVKLGLTAAMLALAWRFRGGFGDVDRALAHVGWAGLAAVCGFHLLPLSLCALAWRALLPGEAAATFLLGRWVRDAVGHLLAFLPLVGEVAGARLLARRGVPAGLAGASTVVDLTAEVVAQAMFTLIGLGLWAALHPEAAVARWGAVGVAASLPVVAGLVAAQRGGLVGLVEGLPARLMPGVWRGRETGPRAGPGAGPGPGIDAGVASLWAERGRVGRSVALHLAAWLAGCGAAWAALALMGHPLDVPRVVALESMVFAIRAAAFVVPAGLGVQEGGYVVLGAALGLPAEAALAVSLLKRGRELVFGLPALVTWQLLGRASSGSA